MPRTALTVQSITPAGLQPAYSAGDAVNQHQFENDGDVFLHVKNTGGSPVTVTIQTPAKVGGVDVMDPAITVPATTGDRMIGPFDPTIFNQAGGVVYADLSGATGVTLAAIRFS